MNYRKRDLEERIRSLSLKIPCILVTGPRQIGKTAMMERLTEGNRKYVSLEDFEERRLAVKDPALFLQLNAPPVWIDEIQYAPELFSYVRIAADNGARPGDFWLTASGRFGPTQGEPGSEHFVCVSMYSFSQHELYGSGEGIPFSVSLDGLIGRRQAGAFADAKALYQRIWKGAMPGLYDGEEEDRERFFGRYMQTFLDRDVSERVTVSDKLQFRDFIRAAACRIGQVLNIHEMGREVGVSDDTAKRWVQVLEDCGLIFLLPAWAEAGLKRGIKKPKLYFWDTGLIAYLTGYSSPDILMRGAVSQTVLENYAAAEILKSFSGIFNREQRLYYYRDKEGNEVNLVLQDEGRLHPILVRRSVNPDNMLTKTFRVLEKASVPLGHGAVLCMHSDLSAFDARNFIVPVWMI